VLHDLLDLRGNLWSSENI